MEYIERVKVEIEKEDKEIKFIGFNSNRVLTIVFEDEDILNFNGEELIKLKNFMNKIDL